MPEEPGFPTVYEYALARRCPTCRAEAGLPCNAPRKHDAIADRNRVRAQLGQPPLDVDPLHLLHVARVDAGSRHQDRDIAAAPWLEDRMPGRRYDTLDKLKNR